MGTTATTIEESSNMGDTEETVANQVKEVIEVDKEEEEQPGDKKGHPFGDQGGSLTRIHLYVHETFKGANSTAIRPVASPLGANSSFGSVGVLDDELRVGRDRASELLGRFQGLVLGTGLEGGANYLTSVTFVFTAGDYQGSTLLVVGPVLGFKGAIERPVVGGTGQVQDGQRGYSMLKLLGNPTPETVLFEVDLFVLVHRGKY
ncbi:dirigent protein 21 [Setaria viridis]|uniref:dirigent protein 21 n=1 Tax=Setaria viridis TaxID=4556 RepID=UPI001493C25A|nr:dirigent protein 21-like [Setaria viridis]